MADTAAESGSGSESFDIGTSVPFHTGRDPVNVPMMRRWCDALGYVNPLHTDADVAARSQFGEIVAPLAMLDVWTNPGLAYHRAANPQGAAFDLLDQQGFTAAVAVRSELAQQRPLRLGMAVTSTITLESVGPEKPTGLGLGRFVATRQDFFAGGDQVGHARMTVLKYQPPAQAAPKSGGASAATEPASAPPAPPEPSRDELGTIVAGALRPGTQLPTLTVPVTTTLIVSGALATSDFFEAHHNRGAAQSRGLPDVFMNIHTTLGLVERYAGGWLGPNALWESMSVRLGVPNHPGDQMTFTGQVVAADPDGLTTLKVEATNRLGQHAQAAVVVRLPI